MSASSDSRLFGTWQTDPEDVESLRQFGTVNLVFWPNGTMAYVVHEGGRQHIMLMVYRTEGDTLVTDQPSAPREDRTQYQITREGRLATSGASGIARYVRVSADYPMSPIEAEGRRKLAATPPRSPPDRLSRTWGGTSDLREYRAAGKFRLWYPASWAPETQYDKQPAVVLRDPRGLGRLRIGVITFEPPRRGLLKRQASPDQITREVFEMLRLEHPDAREVQLADKVAMQHSLEDEVDSARCWTFGKGKRMVTATYSVPKEAVASPLLEPELGIAVKILETLVLEDY